MPSLCIFFYTVRLKLYTFVEILGVLVLVALVIRYLHVKTRRLPLPPGPKPLPVIGNLLDVPSNKAWETFGKWGENYGDIVHITLFRQPYLILNSFKVVSDLFEKRSSIYSGRPHFTMVNDMMDFGKSTTMMQYGNLWRKHRTLLHQHTNPTVVQEYQPRQVAATRRLLRSLLETPENYRGHIRNMISEVVMGIAYGHDTEPDNDPFVRLSEQAAAAFTHAIRPGAFLVDVIPWLRHIPEWVPGAGFQKVAKESKKFWIDSLELPFADVKRRLAEGTASPSFVAKILADMDTSDSQLEEDSEEILKAVAGTFYVAGTDTTLALIHSFLLAMVLYPNVQRKAQNELDSVVGYGRHPQFSDRGDLPYLEAILKEVLRWHPVKPTALPHTVEEDDVYEGYHIPKGTVVIANAWGILHDPEMYPRPMEFLPERFLSIEEGKFVRDPVVAGAFGYGRRICPGRHIVDSSLWTVVASMLASFNIAPEKDEQGHEIDVRYALDPVLQSSSPLPMLYQG